MSISGKILIDKLRICIPFETITELGLTPDSYKEKIKEVLKKYYPAKAYRVSQSGDELKITLTPTRFKPPLIVNFTDTNLEMPTETWFLNLFNELGVNNRRLYESARIVCIHLTKNIITSNIPKTYIDYLQTYPFKKGYVSGFIRSDNGNDTIRIATLKRKKEKSDITGDRNIIFYDKVRELSDKANLKEIWLKEPLSKKEIEVIKTLGVTYKSKRKILSLSNLNLLRCELQYKYKEKIKPLAKFLNNDTDETLTLANIVDLLNDNELYNRLNLFFINQLKTVIFYNTPDKEVTIKQNKIQKSFMDLMTNDTIQELKLIYKACGLEDKFHENQQKLNLLKENELYKELYHKLGLGESG